MCLGLDTVHTGRDGRVSQSDLGLSRATQWFIAAKGGGVEGVFASLDF